MKLLVLLANDLRSSIKSKIPGITFSSDLNTDGSNTASSILFPVSLFVICRLLSESDLLRAVQREAEKIKEQVITDCEEIKRKAIDEAENLRNQALDEAARIKDGATVYAEQVLVNLEQNLNQLQEIVKNGQVQLERRRVEADEQLNHNYVNQRPEFAQDFKMN